MVDTADLGPDVRVWRGHHTGYARLDPSLRHDREVRLDPATGVLAVVDTLAGSASHTARLSWHLGPDVEAVLVDGGAELSWAGSDGPCLARLDLPGELTWTAHRGATDPIEGWYSPRFGERVPATTLVGVGSWSGRLTLRTVFEPGSAAPEGSGSSRHGTAAGAMPPNGS